MDEADSTHTVVVAPTIASLVRPAAASVQPVIVRVDDARLNESLRLAARALREATRDQDTVTAVRTMYKAVGLDPTKTRPSSEALVRRVQKGGELPRVNNLVDVINWCSAESRLPFGLYDLAHIRGGITLRLGTQGEGYPGIRKDVVHLAGRLALADDVGAFGNPTSDSARTMVTTDTTSALIVIFAPATIAHEGARALATTLARIRQFCQAVR